MLVRTILKKEKVVAAPKGKAAAKSKSDSGAPKRPNGTKPDVKADEESKAKIPRKARKTPKGK